MTVAAMAVVPQAGERSWRAAGRQEARLGRFRRVRHAAPAGRRRRDSCTPALALTEPQGRAACREGSVQAELSASSPAAGGSSGSRLPPLREWPVTATVALRTGCYITAAGLALLAAPTTVFGLMFDASLVPAGWIRVGGVLASLFGTYYLGAALDDVEGRQPRRFYQATVAGRLLLSAAFAALVAARQVSAPLLWLAVANAASSLVLWRAARRRAAADAVS